VPPGTISKQGFKKKVKKSEKEKISIECVSFFSIADLFWVKREIGGF